MLYDAAVIAAVFFLIACFGVFRNTAFPGRFLWLGIPLALTALIRLPQIIGKAREESLSTRVSGGTYPRDARVLIRAALRGRDPALRLAALEKLPYPEERAAILRTALEDRDLRNRLAALKKLPEQTEAEAVKDAEDALIRFCEDFVRGYGDRVFTGIDASPEIREDDGILLAASVLTELYRKHAVPRRVKREESLGTETYTREEETGWTVMGSGVVTEEVEHTEYSVTVRYSVADAAEPD